MSTHSTTIIAWLARRLSAAEAEHLQTALAGASGVRTARVRTKVPHVVVVEYDPQGTSSGVLLDRIRREGVQAHLMVA